MVWEGDLEIAWLSASKGATRIRGQNTLLRILTLHGDWRPYPGLMVSVDMEPPSTFQGTLHGTTLGTYGR